MRRRGGVGGDFNVVRSQQNVGVVGARERKVTVALHCV